MEPSDPTPPPVPLRLSDADRHQAAEVLREAAGEGRLTMAELDERLEAAYAARVADDLVPLLVDLPGHADTLPALPRASVPVGRGRRTPATGGPRHEGSYAVMSECKRAGAWTLGEEHAALAVMGSVVLDLRDAELTARETVITANTVMGSIEVVVDAWTAVVVDGMGIMGSFEHAKDKVPAELEPGSPVVRVKGFALMGSVEVRRKGEPRTPRKRLRGA